MSVLVLPLLPLAGGAGVLLLRSRPRLSGGAAVAALVATLVAGAWAALAEPGVRIAWSPAFELALQVEGFGRVMVVLVPFIATPIVAYAAASEPEGRARLLSLMLAFVASMLLLVVAADFISLLIAWELVGATSWALIGHAWRDRANVEAATQAFLTTRLGDLGLYAAAGATFAASGSFGFDGLAGAASPWREIAAGGVLLAAAAKSAQIPFSPWLFAAMAGPTPVSALLHSATLVAAGAYLLIRLSPDLAQVPWLMPLTAVIGITTALAGGVVATLQPHAKRALAASTSAQYGLMFVAIGAGSTAAAGAQLVTHAAFKSLLFLAVGVAIHATGTALVGRMRLGRTLPFTAAAAGIGALALAGVPPLGGAWTKEAILAAALETSAGLGVATLVAGFLTAIYAGRLWLLAFGPGGRRPGPQPTRAELAALAVLAAATLALGALFFPGSAAVVEELTGGMIPRGALWELALSLAVLGGAGLVLLSLGRRGRRVDLYTGPRTQAALADWLALPRLTSLLVVAPTLRLAGGLARADDRVIDAGVRASVRIADLASMVAARRVEISVDAVVRLIATATRLLADGSRRADDSAVDGAVEGTARGIGLAGRHSRRLQTGLTHQYFVIAAAGLVLIAIILAAAR